MTEITRQSAHISWILNISARGEFSNVMFTSQIKNTPTDTDEIIFGSITDITCYLCDT